MITLNIKLNLRVSRTSLLDCLQNEADEYGRLICLKSKLVKKCGISLFNLEYQLRKLQEKKFLMLKPDEKPQSPWVNAILFLHRWSQAS